jgi:hypothetical protein
LRTGTPQKTSSLNADEVDEEDRRKSKREIGYMAMDWILVAQNGGVLLTQE